MIGKFKVHQTTMLTIETLKSLSWRIMGKLCNVRVCDWYFSMHINNALSSLAITQKREREKKNNLRDIQWVFLMYSFSNCPHQMDRDTVSSQTTRVILALIKQRKWWSYLPFFQEMNRSLIRTLNTQHCVFKQPNTCNWPFKSMDVLSFLLFLK